MAWEGAGAMQRERKHTASRMIRRRLPNIELGFRVESALRDENLWPDPRVALGVIANRCKDAGYQS